MLYLAGRCAIMQDHLDHNRTLVLTFKACHILSFSLSASLGLFPSFPFPPFHVYMYLLYRVHFSAVVP